MERNPSSEADSHIANQTIFTFYETRNSITMVTRARQ
jgi:hypothetical protein